MSPTPPHPRRFAGRWQTLTLADDRLEIRTTGWPRLLPFVPHRVVLRRDLVLGAALGERGSALFIYTADGRTLTARLDDAAAAARDALVAAVAEADAA